MSGMRSKAILTILFLFSIGLVGFLVVRAMPETAKASAAPKTEILVAAAPLATGTLLRAQDVRWQAIAGTPKPGEIVRPSLAARQAKPEADEEARGEVFGAALRAPLAADRPITRADIVKPGDREFLHVVLSPGARAINVPMAMTSGLLFPGDRVDVILTQSFKNDATPLTRRSVGETVVENLRVLAIETHEKSSVARHDGLRTITLEVMPEQAEKVNVAAELGKLSLTLRSTITADNRIASSTPGPGEADRIKPTWAGDVSPALKAATPPPKVVAAEKPVVRVLRGSKSEQVKPE